MSSLANGLLAFALAGTALPAMAQAQVQGQAQTAPSAPDTATAAAAIDRARADYGPPPPRKRCRPAAQTDGTADGAGITVCGAADSAQYRVTSPTDDGRTHGEGDVPSAPDVFGIPNLPIVVATFGKVPPPVYVVDFDALPEPPAGSDAAQIADGTLRGE